MFEQIRKRRINIAFKNNKRKRFFCNLKTMEKVLILFHYKDWKQIQLISKDLESIGKEVILWTVEANHVKIDHTVPFAMRVISKNEKSALRCISKAVEREFKALEYDTLIDFCQNDRAGIQILSYLLAINNAKFCIGNRKHFSGVYDLTVIQPKNQGILEVFAQMKIYLQNIIP